MGNHNYPTGAVEDEKMLMMSLLGQNLYGVHALGENSFLTVMNNVRNLHNCPFTAYRVIEYTDITRPRDPWESSCCLGDFNIGSHHNKHYLFRTLADAEAYLQWARNNTSQMRGSKSLDYDYDGLCYFSKEI